MPRYALLIYDEESAWEDMSPEDRAARMEAYYDFTEDVTKAGVAGASDALESVSTARTVRVRDGDRMVTDGPFAETKEQLGGFYIVECETVEQALDWAARIPSAQTGSIEVRPIVDFPPRQAAGSEGENA